MRALAEAARATLDSAATAGSPTPKAIARQLVADIGICICLF